MLCGEDIDDVDEDGAGGDVAAAADLNPRPDTCECMTDELMFELAGKNWKVRKEALDNVVVNEVKFITNNIGPLPEALKPRLTDSNNIVDGVALTLCQQLATSMGPGIKQYVRVLGPGIVSNFGDSKPSVRQSAMQTLNTWVERIGLAIIVKAQTMTDALKLENQILRAELLGWFAIV